MREKMIQKIRNQTMGDVMFEHLKDSFGAELKVKDDGGASKSGSGVEGGAIKEKDQFQENSPHLKKMQVLILGPQSWGKSLDRKHGCLE